MKEIESIIVRFSGDSGDGMQLTGTQFSNTSAIMGNDLATFPDFPAEIRAPQGTVAGVSGFQVHIGSSEVGTPGDEPDVLVAMNPAALKANLSNVKKGGMIIVNLDSFDEKNIKKAGYLSDPLENEELYDFQVIKASITSQTLKVLKEIDIDRRSKIRCKNLYALGMTYFMFGREVETTVEWLQEKFKKDEDVMKANILALKAGRNFAETLETVISTYYIPPAKIKPGKYRQINGNTSIAWGFIQAAKAADLELFLGSYPITPATDILHELSKYKEFGVRTFQAEDEIAGVCSAIGASFGGALAITTSSGPGISLKAEAIGLGIVYELPLVLVNVQRGGPSTGLPTKTEQSDLMQAMFGRNGESPIIVVAASRPNDCFHMAYEASRLALQTMSPVFLLSDGYIANGSEPWMLPDLQKEYPAIKNKKILNGLDGKPFSPYKRDERLVRSWAVPGTVGYEHRLGGLEKDLKTGNVSYDPENHQKMCEIRLQKVKYAEDLIPLQEIEGKDTGDLLVISWGGTYGATQMAVKKIQEEGFAISLMHLRYLNPMPKNVGEIISQFKNILVAELNFGQLKDIINMKFSCGALGYHKVQGLPFKISELQNIFREQLNSK